MIDFGMAWIREKNMSDVDWAYAKDMLDEAGCIGVVMKDSLQEIGFELQYDEDENRPYSDQAMLHPKYYGDPDHEGMVKEQRDGYVVWTRVEGMSSMYSPRG